MLLNTKKWKRYIQLLYENERLFALRSSSSKELRLQMDWKIPFRWQLDDMETCERARVKFVRDYGPNLYPGPFKIEMNRVLTFETKKLRSRIVSQRQFACMMFPKSVPLPR